MNSLQISKIIYSDKYSKKIFLGVLARDELPQKVKWPCSFILNTDKSTEPGQHWLAINYSSHGKCEFFDSLGFGPDFYDLTKFLTNTSNSYEYNKNSIQSIFSEYCGYYCVLFLLIRSRNYSFRKFLMFFDKNTLFNDKLIEKLIKFFL